MQHINKTGYIRLSIGNNEIYGIRYQDIADVKPAANITIVPTTPEFVEGVEYWHGKIISVINTGSYFGIESGNNADNEKFVVTVVHEKIIAGLIFDDVIGVDSYDNAKIDRNISINQKISDKYIDGIYDGKVVILNVTNLLTDISMRLNGKKGA